MNRKILQFAAAFFCCLLFVFASNAQKEKVEVNKKGLSEINEFRQKMIQAIEKRDRATLEILFADDFTHTHAVGKFDSKSQRINSILEGGKTIEIVEPDEITIRFYGKNTAVAVGQTTVDETIYRWTVVYVKNKKSWQLAASQASKKV